MRLAFEVLDRTTTHTTYRVHTQTTPSGELTQPNDAFDAIIDLLDRNLDADIEFHAVYHLAGSLPIRYRNGFWYADCDVHPSATLTDEDLLACVAIVGDHDEELHE